MSDRDLDLLAIDMNVTGKVWFAPTAKDSVMYNLLRVLLEKQGLPFPLDKAHAIQVTLHKVGDPNDPTKKAAADFLPIVAAAFTASPNDAPQMVQVDPTGGFAVVSLGRVVAPGAPPVAQIRAVVARDFQIDRARRAARAIANDIVAKANKGQSLAALFAASGVKAPPVEPLNTSRAQMTANPKGAPPPLVLMFSMAENSAKLLEAPNNQGWIVVKLDKIDRGNATGNTAVIRATQDDLGKVVGREYAEQFSNAVKGVIGVKKNVAAIAALKARLLGQTAAN